MRFYVEAPLSPPKRKKKSCTQITPKSEGKKSTENLTRERGIKEKDGELNLTKYIASTYVNVTCISCTSII
jgi:hypothetical protein